MPLSQQNRYLNLTTPVGDDVLLLTSFFGNEEMSRLFTYELEMISDNDSIEASEIVGQNVTFSVLLPDDSRRFFNGIVSHFMAGEMGREQRRRYRAEVVPWFWFLTRTADCRIFQNKTVPEIIEQVLSDLGFSDYELQIQLDHKNWEYCVQYRETDFNFLSRLMEQEGIFYFFKHEDGKHTLVMADHKGAYFNCPEGEVDMPADVTGVAVTDHLTEWEHHYEFRPGKFAQTDFDFKKPSTNLMTETDTVVELPDVDKYEVYDYPGEYVEKSDGETETRIRMEEEETSHDVVCGSSTCRTFATGAKFKVGTHHSSNEEGKSYVITSIQHTATEMMAYESGTDVPETDYTNSFDCIPDDVVFRPARITPKPLTSGVQTAIVVGPSGEEIYTDEYGRVKVQFHWDREGQRDENSSCWIRVAQNWAGEKWGIVFNPRIGQEVIVDFVQGDPDRPIITGRVYNAEQMPPYDLPGEQTKSTIKTRSSKNGDSNNFNEIRFEDKKGSEELYIHAEKDRKGIVENNHTLHVAANQKTTIGGNQDLKVGGPHCEFNPLGLYIPPEFRSDPIGGNQSIEVWHDQTTTIKTGDRKVTVELGNDTLDIKGNRTVEIWKDRKTTIDTGNDSLKVTLGKSKTEAMQSIELKVGQSSIKLDQNGITMRGFTIDIEAELQADFKSNLTAGINTGASLAVVGAMVDIN